MPFAPLRRATAVCALWIALLTCPARAYENPILLPIRDPDCILLDGTYYLIEPGGSQAAGGFFNLRVSRDLVHWSGPQRILKQQPGLDLWQGAFYRDTEGNLYLYYAVVDAARHKSVRVSLAATPFGPFLELGFAVPDAIDPYPFRDDDGALWLYYKNDQPGQKGIWAQRMAGPAEVYGPPVEVLHPQPGTFEDGGYLTTEGPTLIKLEGVYFLLYSGGPFGSPRYAVGYAAALSPDGPFTRAPNNPLLSNAKAPNVFSPGVASVVADGAGALWLVYRQRTTFERQSPRELAIDALDTSRAAEGLLMATPTKNQPMPDPVPLP